MERFGVRSRKDINEEIPMDEWALHHRMIFFGRYHCKSAATKCEECPLLEVCREGKKRMKGNKGWSE